MAEQTIPQALKELRDSHPGGNAGMANDLGWHRSILSSIITGKRVLTLKRLQRIAALYPQLADLCRERISKDGDQG